MLSYKAFHLSVLVRYCQTGSIEACLGIKSTTLSGAYPDDIEPP